MANMVQRGIQSLRTALGCSKFGAYRYYTPPVSSSLQQVYEPPPSRYSCVLSCNCIQLSIFLSFNRIRILTSKLGMSGEGLKKEEGYPCSIAHTQCIKAAKACDHEYASLEWDNLGFGLMPTDYMYMMKCSKDENFKQGQLSRFGNIELSPSAGVLNYGQGILEGTKAYRKENGSLLLFRPDQHAIRMKIGAERMCMPSPSIEQFIDAVKQTAFANKRWVPPLGKGSLYMRPLLIGTGPILGLAPATEYTFLVYASPVANYFKGGIAPLNFDIEEEFARACPGGAGGVKSISNYAPALKALLRAKERGFSDVLYLDSEKRKFLEEASACNVFILKGNRMSTPATNGTILAGITRKSIIDIARDLGYQVKEQAISVDELLDADEVFCTGTAIGVVPVGSVTYQGRRIQFRLDNDSVCQELQTTLVGIQTGLIEDKKGWTVEIH